MGLWVCLNYFIQSISLQIIWRDTNREVLMFPYRPGKFLNLLKTSKIAGFHITFMTFFWAS